MITTSLEILRVLLRNYAMSVTGTQGSRRNSIVHEAFSINVVEISYSSIYFDFPYTKKLVHSIDFSYNFVLVTESYEKIS